MSAGTSTSPGTSASEATASPLPDTWTLTASAFNWTPDVVRAERPAPDIAVGIVRDGVAPVIELEAGQAWRTFPDPDDAEVDALRTELERAGGRVSIVGASIDDWALPARRRRDDDERFAFLVPQLRAASRLGATGVRLPIGQAGPALLQRLLPVLHELDLVLFEEAQGRQTPGDSGTAAAFAAVAALDDPHVRVLIDISMLMPALPVTYIDALAEAGLAPTLLERIAADWRDPATMDVVIAALRGGDVPPQARTLYMDMLVRFGRSDAAVLRDVLPLVTGFHLKFWDLEDADGRVSDPIRDLGELLAGSASAGTLASEWGGHEWLDDDPGDTTRRHLALARDALAEGLARA